MIVAAVFVVVVAVQVAVVVAADAGLESCILKSTDLLLWWERC